MCLKQQWELLGFVLKTKQQNRFCCIWALKGNRWKYAYMYTHILLKKYCNKTLEFLMKQLNKSLRSQVL